MKAALRSPEGAPGARPAAQAPATEQSLAEQQLRREHQLKAFLFRQARARAEREARLEAENVRGVVPSPRPPRAAAPAGAVTVPLAPCSIEVVSARNQGSRRLVQVKHQSFAEAPCSD